MLVQPTTLSLITTHKCTAACDHCCFHCTPKIEIRIPPERLESLIAEAAALETLRVVVFTGGECFLIPELDDRIAQAHRLGLATRCVTNGYWAFSPERAALRASTLVAAGLNEINFSTGRFHGEYVPVERIAYGARAASDAGILTLITVETCDQEDPTAQTLLAHPLIADSIKSGEILFQRNVWIENEGKTDLTHPASHSRFNEERISGCKTALDVLAITPTMSLVACCGLHLERIPELHIGSVAERSLREVIDQAEDDFMKIWLHISGPERMYQFAREKDASIDLPTTSAHPCETCLLLFRDSKAMEILRQHYPAVEQQVLHHYMTDLMVNRLDTRLARRALERQAMHA